MASKGKQPVKGSLEQLGEILQRAGISPADTPKAAEPAPSSVPVKPRLPESTPPSEATDHEVFAEAMKGVSRASWKPEPHPASRQRPSSHFNAEAENRRLMLAAMDEETPIAIPEHPEYIEGWVGGTGKRFLPNLRNGLYSIQGQLDLHGLNRAESEAAVEEYIVQMSRYRACCVKIIHGRGINSPADRATLKESLQRLLSTRKMSRYVLAYASAAARDGGVGAVYVLLGKS